jgi:hypothetical protein
MPILKQFGNNVCEQSSTIGTGTYELDGALLGYQDFDSEFALNDTPYYAVKNAGETKYEYNKGPTAVFTPGSPDTLARSVWLSSNSNAAVAWDADDLPLIIYIPTSGEVLEAMVSNWLAASRNALINFGLWSKLDGISSGIHQLNWFDGTSDIVMGQVNATTHTANLKGTSRKFYFETSAVAGPVTTSIPFDNTIPQNTEGTSLAAFAGLAFSVHSATSKIRVRLVLNVGHVSTDAVGAAIFINSVANAVASGWFYTGSTSTIGQLVIEREITNPGIGAHTMSVRFGNSGSGSAVYINAQGGSGAARNGGTWVSALTIEEFFE